MLNGNLDAQWEVMCPTGIIMCSTEHYWGAQWEFSCSQLEINGVHIVVVVNNILNVKPSPSRVLSHMHLMCDFCMEGWIELRTL